MESRDYALGTFGICRRCGTAIILSSRPIDPNDGADVWLHFGVGPNHYGRPKPSLRDAVTTQ